MQQRVHENLFFASREINFDMGYKGNLLKIFVPAENYKYHKANKL
jgi:hypothetical protein